MKRSVAVLLPLAVLAACQDQHEPLAPADPAFAPAAAVQEGEVRPGGYIVVLHQGANPRAVAAVAGVEPEFVYEHALQGFSATLNQGQLRALQAMGAVAYIEPDRVRHIAAQTVPTGVQRIFADDNGNLDIDGVDDYRVDVDVAIIDTGIDFEHPDLNVAGGVNCTGKIFTAKCVTGGDDDHYHGTHVAGTVGALDNGSYAVGVAPGARLWAVKVLNKNGSGYTSWIVAGIDWVAANAGTIEVANMSLGGSGYSTSEYNAIQGAVNKGVAFAVAAGNNDDDANNYSPSAFDNVLVVSALADFNGAPGGGAAPTCRSDVDDSLADFSNWGNEVDIAAPGVCIYSTFPLEQGGYGTISGTSMASPHAAGALALLASRNKPTNASQVYALYNTVEAAGNSNWTDDSGDGIKEPLLDVSNTNVFNPVLVPGGGGGPPNTPPSVTISSPTDGASFPYGTSIAFGGSANDAEDGPLTSGIVWTSSKDGQIGTGGSFSKVLSDGPHTITASVTDAGSLTGSASVSITVEPEPPVGGVITLWVVDAYMVRTNKYVDLGWDGAVSGSVDVYRDGSLVATTTNDGSYTDKPSKKLTSVTYKVCEAGTSVCANEVTATWQ